MGRNYQVDQENKESSQIWGFGRGCYLGDLEEFTEKDAKKTWGLGFSKILKVVQQEKQLGSEIEKEQLKRQKENHSSKGSIKRGEESLSRTKLWGTEGFQYFLASLFSEFLYSSARVQCSCYAQLPFCLLSEMCSLFGIY